MGWYGCITPWVVWVTNTFIRAIGAARTRARDVPGYLAEVHHVTIGAAGRRTDIDDLTLACGPHNRLVETGGRRTQNYKTQPHYTR